MTHQPDDQLLDEVLWGIAGWADKQLAHHSRQLFAPNEAKQALISWRDAAIAEELNNVAEDDGEIIMCYFQRDGDCENDVSLSDRIKALNNKEKDNG